MHTVGVAQEGLDWPTKGDLAIITQSVLDIPIVFDDITVTYVRSKRFQPARRFWNRTFVTFFSLIVDCGGETPWWR